MTEKIEVRIKALGADGDGIGTYLDEAIFVPGAAPGDLALVEAGPPKKSGRFAKLLKVLEPGAGRAEPVCKHFESCGGCQLQFLKPDDYRDWIVERIETVLGRHGFEAGLVKEPIFSPPNSRRRVALKALNMPGGLVLGYNKRQSHQIVNVKECPVTHTSITELFTPLRSVLAKVLGKRMQADVHVTVAATGIDMLVDAPMELDLGAREVLVEFANSYDIASLHWRDDGFLDPVIIRREALVDLSGTLVPLVPATFLQATSEGERALVKEVLKACEGSKRVADLFCGLGTFSFPLAKHYQVLAAEGSKPALDAMKLGVNRAVGLKQVVVKHRDLYRRPLSPKELSGFDAVVLDPPRPGAKEQMLELVQSTVKRVVSVSCNPNTFSRDARILADGGYVLERVVPVDQFLWSPHIEVVGVFSRA